MQREISELWLSIGYAHLMLSIMCGVTGVLSIMLAVTCLGMRSLQNQINELKDRLP